MMEYAVRFLVGGIVVSAFSMLGDMLRPKSFAGLFGATMAGALAKSLKVLFKGNARCFGRYYSGKDVWPRPSAVVQVEIDQRMPAALDWLRYELKEALEEEAASPLEARIDDGKAQ